MNKMSANRTRPRGLPASRGAGAWLRPRGAARCGLLALLACLAGCEGERQEERPSTPAASAAPATTVRGGNLERIRAAKVLRIGIKADSPPFCFQDKDGTPLGFDVDLGYRLARRLGVQPLYVQVSTAERLERLKKGEVDCVIATLTATRRRAKEVDFSIPYFQDQQRLLVKAGSPIQSYRDLAGRSVAVVEGSTSIANLKIVTPDCKTVACPSMQEVFEKLKNGEADAATGDGLALLGLRHGDAAPEAFRFAGEGFSVEPYAIGLPRNDSDYRQAVDEFLTELWSSGAWTRLFNKWLGAQSPYNLEAQFQMPVLPP